MFSATSSILLLPGASGTRGTHRCFKGCNMLKELNREYNVKITIVKERRSRGDLI